MANPEESYPNPTPGFDLMKRPRLVRFLLLALSAFLGCEDNGSGPEPDPLATASVDVGNILFRSARNASTNPAMDTVAAGGTVTWTWTEIGSHGLRFDDPAFPASPEASAVGSQHSVTFPAPGSYTYDCTIHGPIMNGRIVVR
jgi:plastocyanin